METPTIKWQYENLPTEKTGITMLGSGLKSEKEIELLMVKEEEQKFIYLMLFIVIIVMSLNFIF